MNIKNFSGGLLPAIGTGIVALLIGGVVALAVLGLGVLVSTAYIVSLLYRVELAPFRIVRK